MTLNMSIKMLEKPDQGNHYALVGGVQFLKPKEFVVPLPWTGVSYEWTIPQYKFNTVDVKEAYTSICQYKPVNVMHADDIWSEFHALIQIN